MAAPDHMLPEEIKAAFRNILNALYIAKEQLENNKPVQAHKAIEDSITNTLSFRTMLLR